QIYIILSIFFNAVFFPILGVLNGNSQNDIYADTIDKCMSEPIVVDIQNLTKIYPGRNEPAVNNLNLQIHQGEFYGLIGPNGAGKTTTISVMSGLLKPTDGEIFIQGYNLKRDLSKIKEIIGVVPHEIALYDKLTAFENLYYFGRLYGVKKVQLKKSIDSLLERFGLIKYKNDKLRSYSGGMKRRINLIAGILHNPNILILDEPVLGVDVHSRKVIREFIKEVNANNTTIIYTSHMMEDVEKLCTRLSIIDYGELVAQGSSGELIANNKDCNSLEEVFLKVTG
ncbi:ABC transporter ATP-binding protein, partial [Bacteroidota bacterium]